MMPRPTRTELMRAAGLYLLLALVWSHQLFFEGFGSSLPNDLGDPLFSTWLLWWDAHAPSMARWWNAPAFYPAEGVLAFSEAFLGISLLTHPLMALGASPPAAYNTAFVFSFAACATTTYLLCRECTGSDAAALVGGAYFGFGPHRAAHLPHLQVLWAFWLPVLFLALFRYRATARPKYLLLLAVAWIGVACSNLYLLLYGAVGATLWAAWFLANRHGFRRLVMLAGTGVAASLVILPLMVEFRRWHEYYGLKRSVAEMESFSADGLALLSGWDGLWTWTTIPGLVDRPEGALYPGLFTFLLLMLAAWRWWRTRPPIAASSRLSTCLAVAGVAMIGVGLAAIRTSGTEWSIGPLEIHVRTPYKPIGAACVLLLTALLWLPRVGESRRRGSVVGWWICCALSAYIFALGPTGRLAGERFWYKAPYSWLLWLPGFDAARVPARFGTLFALALAVLVAIAVRRLAQGQGAAWIPAAALMAVLVDGAVTVQAVRVPDAVHAEGWGVDMVLEIPLDTYRNVAAMSGSFTHGLPVVNGYSGFEPPHYRTLAAAIAERRVSPLDELRRVGTLAVVVDRSTEEGRIWTSLLAQFARPDLFAPGGRDVFVLPHLPERSACLARALGPQSAEPRIVAASAADPLRNPGDIGLALDGNSATFHLVSASTAAGDGIEVALDRERSVGGLILWMGTHSADHPGLLAVAVRSTAGLHTVFEGDVAGLAMAGALADPRRAPLAICFPPIAARSLVVRAPAATGRTWSVAEISVLGR